MKKLKIWRNLLIVLNISIPVISIIAMYISKSKSYENNVSFISFLVSTALFILTTLSIIFKLDETIVEYRKSIENNFYIKSKVELYLKALVDISSLSWFLEEVSRITVGDFENILFRSDKERQYIYREAIKEYIPNNAKCPDCGVPVWVLKKKRKASMQCVWKYENNYLRGDLYYYD